MKNTRPINTRQMFIVPLIVLFIVTISVGLTTFYFTANRFKQTMITSGTVLAETLSVGISNDIKHKENYLSSLNSTLISAGNYIIANRDLITNEYLNEIANTFILTNIYWYNAEGLLLNDANDEFVGWTPSIGDPIYTFMHSGFNVYIEDIRKGTDNDQYYKFIYIKDFDGYFIQVGINANQIKELIQHFEFQYIIEQFVANNSGLLYALIIDTNFITIADTDIDEIGADYSGDDDYKKVLSGITLGSDWYYEKQNEVILEISTPIYHYGDIIGILGIGYSYHDYYEIRAFLSLIFVFLILIIMVFYASVQYARVINPLKQFSKKIENVDLENITEIASGNVHGVLSGLNLIFTDLITKVFEKEKENKDIIRRVTDLAFTDQLTQLPNRNAILKMLRNMCKSNNKLAVIYIDIDDFKTINDTRGHSYGDVLIQHIAYRLVQVQIEGLFVSRHQGDEFLVIYTYDDNYLLEELIEEIKKQFNTPIEIEGSSLFVEFSMGIALYPKDGKSPEELLHKADVAMYEAKKEDKMTHMFFNDEMSAQLNRRNEVLQELNDAIINDGFQILYQPQVDIDKNEVVGLEALLRIKGSTISPYEFIPIAEQNRLINRIGRIVIAKVIIQLNEWINLGIKIVPTYVNFSAIQLQDQTISDFIINQLNSLNVPAEMFGVEVTESTIIDKRELTINTLMQMKSIGIKTAIDDFGSGQAGINYMTNFKVDIVKFDKSFSDRYLNEKNIEVYLTILKLTSELGFITLAEGIETKEQVELLKNTSCKLVQGYYYYKPQKPEIITEIFLNGTMKK